MEETFSRIISDFQEIRQTPNTQSHFALIPPSTSVDLQFGFSTGNPELHSQFYDDFASKNLSLSSITHLLALTMDAVPAHVAQLASKVYLSLLLSSNSLVFTLFTPVQLLSFFRSIRRSLKHRPSAPLDESSHGPQAPSIRKGKSGGRGREKKVFRGILEVMMKRKVKRVALVM